MPESAPSSRFESDRIWGWYLQNERRFRRYNSTVPEGHRGHWKTASVAFVGLEPLHTPRGFTPRTVHEHYKQCEEWFNWRRHPKYFSDRVLRQLVSWVPPSLLGELDGGPAVSNARSVPLRGLREFLERHAVAFDVRKVPPTHSFNAKCPVVYVRRQLWRLFHADHPLRCLIARHRRPIDQTLEILEHVKAANVLHWTDGKWKPVDGFKAVRALLDGAAWPVIACDIPGKAHSLIVNFWHGWRCERYSIPDELPTTLP